LWTLMLFVSVVERRPGGRLFAFGAAVVL